MKCFYHSADLDGICSAAIVLAKYPKCELFPINYGDDFPWDLIKTEQVFMVDFSLTIDEMLRLHHACGDNLIWIDHHESKIKDENEYTKKILGIRKVGQAGCELTWEFLHPGEKVPTAVYLLGRYDVWDHTNDMVLPFQWGMRQFDVQPDSEHWRYLLEDGDLATRDEMLHSILSQGATILKYQAAQNQKYIRAYGHEVEFDGLEAIAVNKGFTNSQLFDAVWDEEKYHIMMTYVQKKNGKWNVSIYSTRDDINCGELAKRHGGGGHKGAAGFVTDECPINMREWVRR